jgi:hypothetical protein
MVMITYLGGMMVITYLVEDGEYLPQAGLQPQLPLPGGDVHLSSQAALSF